MKATIYAIGSIIFWVALFFASPVEVQNGARTTAVSFALLLGIMALAEGDWK